LRSKDGEGSLPQTSSPSQALPRQLPQRGSQAVKFITKVLGAMRKLPAVLLALPLGELSPQVTERASLLSPQRRAFAESGAANAVSHYDPSREKAILENPQIFQNCEIKIIFPLFMRRATRSAFKIVPPRAGAHSPKRTTARHRGQNCTGRSCVKRRIALSCVGSIGELPG